VRKCTPLTPCEHDLNKALDPPPDVHVNIIFLRKMAKNTKIAYQRLDYILKETTVFSK